MLFWIICCVMAVAVTAAMTAPLLRRQEIATVSPDVAIYRAQLDEIDRDVANGVLAAEMAEQTRAEIARRLIAATKAQVSEQQGPPSQTLALGLVAVVTLAAGLGYWQLGAIDYPDIPRSERIANGDAARADRPTQAQAEAATPPLPPLEAAPEYVATVQQLRDLMPTRPDDEKGWRILAFHEAQLGQFPAAVAAQTRVLDILRDTADEQDVSRAIDYMVAATNGFVSPEAETLTRRLLDMNPQNIAGRYYLGALYDRTDRPDIAFRIWREVIDNGDPETYHVALARVQIEDTAFRAGIDYALPVERGPSAADVANAADMSDEDRNAMIGNMVAGLADRLATQGGPATDWARLISAYGVLGRTDDARAIWTEAQDVFGASPADLEKLRAAAQSAGVAE